MFNVSLIKGKTGNAPGDVEFTINCAKKSGRWPITDN